MKNGRFQEDGIELWYFNNELHREDGPACIEPDGTQSWYLHGKLHRVDGPAVMWGEGRRRMVAIRCATPHRWPCRHECRR